ncbi:MAG: hypothetical protein K5866_07590 [Treponema sp.]|nr:hypothetical protein [Treponema sp.]
MEIQTAAKLKEVLTLMEAGRPEEAQKIIAPLFEYDLACEELIYTNRCCVYWIESNRRLKSFEDPYEKGENLLSEWKSYKDFISREEKTFEPANYAVQKGFFSNALKDFEKLFDGKNTFQRAEALKNAGICTKELGDYEKARELIKKSTSIYPESASAIAELADCYCLCGNERIGKLLFREAFFINPEAIDLEFLESELIKYLIKTCREKGYSGRQLRYWIPIYGILNGILTVKRDLTSQEVAKLMNNVFAMESEYKDPCCDSKILVPKLLNHYFWLLDHYMKHGDNRAKVSEILLKVKILDSSIYELYTR